MASEISPTLIQALGLHDSAPDWPQLREALGLHQPPQILFAALERHPDGLPPPHLPDWSEGGVSSPHHLHFFKMSVDDQQAALELQAELNRPVPSAGWLSQLHALQSRNPNVVQLFNYESVWLRRQGDVEGARALTEAVLTRFPGEVFAACALAGYYLAKGDTANIEVMFNRQYELESATPRRFNALELSSFYGIMAWFHLLKGRLLRAGACISIVHLTRPKDPFLVNLSAWLLQEPEAGLLELHRVLKLEGHV
ncbi:MAG: hypothetical protein CVV27_15855 [Candidatus Melainabacteria bacterium HGW-Melainabacteria-1]|nr:MAG: hypothetical protein CVV27_15855 [Candidatus Melainabacteria bacterium HGW-Melainabacteria-1]